MKKKEVNKVLIIRTGAIGDVVHTTNLVHSIKESSPNTKIHYLSSKIVEFLLKEDSAIEKVYTINPKFNLFSSYTINLAKELRTENYDLVINLQPSFKIRMLTFLAGIKKELIYKKDFKIHAVTNFWKTGLKAFPTIQEKENLQLFLSEKAKENANELLKNYRRPFVVFNAGGVFSKRQGRTYPIKNWIELGKKIQEKYNGTIIFNGALEDKEFLAPLNEIPNSIDFIGKLSLEDSCAIISNADLMISGDSGPLHIATALKVKSIGLYGSMPVKRTGCYSNGVNIASAKACVPCNYRKCKYLKGTNKIYAPCMEEIKVQSILNEVDNIFSYKYQR